MIQRDRVLRALRKGPVNTTDFMAPACDQGVPILRLAARVYDLQQDGFGIRTERKLNGTCNYILVRDVGQGSGTTAGERRASPITAAATGLAAEATSVAPLSSCAGGCLFDADAYGSAA